MTQILSNQEIETLRIALSEGKLDTEKTYLEKEIQPYDFVSKKHLPPKLSTILNMVFHRFTLNFRASLSLWLRKVVRMELCPVDNQTFGEFVETLPSLCWINTIEIEPLRGEFLFILETELVLALIDLLCGGSGTPINREGATTFATLEQSLIKKIVSIALSDLEDAWNSIIKVRSVLKNIEFNPQLLTTFAADEPLAIIPIRVTIEKVVSNIVFGIPHFSLNPLKERSMEREGVQLTSSWTKEILNRLLDTEVELIAELGEVEMTLREIIDLKKGSMINLNKGISDKVVVKIQGIPKFEGYPVQFKGNKAIRISIEGGKDETSNSRGKD